MKHVHLSLLLAASAVACGSKKDDAGPPVEHKAVTTDHGSEQPVKKAVSADFFGKTVAPLGPLAQLKWGMSLDDAKKAAPTLFAKGDKDYVSVDDPALEDVRYAVGIDKAKHVVSRMHVTLPGSAKAVVATAWGPGKDAKDSIGEDRTYWFDPAAGWFAYLGVGFGKDLSLELHPYLPAAKLLGDGSDTLGFAPQGVLGATVDDLRTRFPDTIVERSEQPAAKAKPDVQLELLPTEWADYTTPVNFMWTADGKVRDVWFGLPYGAYVPAKDELHALIEKKWGAGKEITYLAQKATLYRDKAPFVIVTDDTIMHAWDIRLVDKKPR